MGLIMGTIPSMLNTVLNPIISFKSDRHRSRWGRRIPFIVATMPFLVACLIGVAYGDQIGFWFRDQFPSVLGHYSPNTIALVTLGVFMTLFAFFNVFVNSVFWYLFNDVVPEALIGRFISWFRVILFFKGILWSLYIFPFAESHFTEIMMAAALLYFLGFGAMCLFVKEGEYPAPPPYVGGKHGALAAMKTYGTECSGLAHYWYLFLMGASIAMVWSTGMFTIFYNKTIGLDLVAIGQIGAIGSVAGLIAIPISGWLSDRYHPIRVVIWAFALQIIVATPLASIWLFWQPSPQVVYWVMALQAVIVGAPDRRPDVDVRSTLADADVPARSLWPVLLGQRHVPFDLGHGLRCAHRLVLRCAHQVLGRIVRLQDAADLLRLRLLRSAVFPLEAV